MEWYKGYFKTDDITVGDVNEFKTVEYWQSFEDSKKINVLLMKSKGFGVGILPL